MIVVDSSVWISHFRNEERPAVRFLRDLSRPRRAIVGDVVLLELLQGARDERHAALIERELRRFPVAPMLDVDSARQAAAHFRALRQVGITLSKLPDLLIATYCVANDLSLLHQDRDYGRIAPHLGLRTLAFTT